MMWPSTPTTSNRQAQMEISRPCMAIVTIFFALGRVGEAIPPELYQAVAEILAVVYRTHRYYFFRLRSRRLEAEVAA